MNIVMTVEEEKVVEILGNEAVEGIVGGVEVGLEMECAMKVEEESIRLEENMALMGPCDSVSTDQPHPSTSAAVADVGSKKTVKVAPYRIITFV